MVRLSTLLIAVSRDQFALFIQSSAHRALIIRLKPLDHAPEWSCRDIAGLHGVLPEVGDGGGALHAKDQWRAHCWPALRHFDGCPISWVPLGSHMQSCVRPACESGQKGAMVFGAGDMIGMVQRQMSAGTGGEARSLWRRRQLRLPLKSACSFQKKPSQPIVP